MNARHKPQPPDRSPLPDISERPPFFGTGVIYPPLAKTEEEREAALQRLLALGDAIAETVDLSDGTKMTRDEMHER